MIKDIMTDAALSDSKLMEPCILDAPFWQKNNIWILLKLKEESKMAIRILIDRATVGSKVYQLDCNSNFIKATSIAYFLFAFML